MRAKSPRQRFKRVEALIKELDSRDEKALRRLIPKVRRELKDYKFLLETLWLWGFRK